MMRIQIHLYFTSTKHSIAIMQLSLSTDATNCSPNGRMEETIWSSSGYLDEDSARWSQVLQAPTDWSSPRASEPAKLKAAGYKWHYAVLCCKPENDDDYDDYDDHDELSLSTCQNVLPTTASNHCLHHLLEPDSSTSQMTLRTRGHSFNLPRFYFDLTKKSFTFRSLYGFIYLSCWSICWKRMCMY